MVISEMREPPYWRDYATWRIRIHGLVTSKYFDLAIAGVIGLNVVTMAMEFYMMPDVITFSSAFKETQSRKRHPLISSYSSIVIQSYG